MKQEQQPLYTLTIDEFIALTKKLIEEAINSKKGENNISNSDIKQNDEEFNILELSKFLHCSKVSIHNYKKLGLPFYRIGRKLLFKKTEVLNFMKSLKHKRILTA
jgi:hypothetical protein